MGFKFTTIHVPGKLNNGPDCMSRYSGDHIDANHLSCSGGVEDDLGGGNSNFPQQVMQVAEDISRYFRDYGNCKFGEFCKFNHEALGNENNIEIDEIKKKLEELKSQIDAKNKEINHKNSEIESMSKKVEHKIAIIEEKMNDMEMNLNELRKENNVLKNMIASKEKESEENVDLEEYFSKTENNLDCNKCDFIGKTESGLKVHKTAKHKVSEQGYRRVSKV